MNKKCILKQHHWCTSFLYLCSGCHASAHTAFPPWNNFPQVCIISSTQSRSESISKNSYSTLFSCVLILWLAQRIITVAGCWFALNARTWNMEHELNTYNKTDHAKCHKILQAATDYLANRKLKEIFMNLCLQGVFISISSPHYFLSLHLYRILWTEH